MARTVDYAQAYEQSYETKYVTFGVVLKPGRALVKLTLAIVLATALFGSLAEAATPTQAPETVSEQKASCVFKDLVSNEACPAYATARALEVLGMGEEAIIFVEKDAAEKSKRTSVLASSRIEDSVLLDQIDEDDAMLLEREVQELSGARYELPASRREITRTLGFPDDATIADSDWIQMLKVHAEMTLSLSANASQFLLEQLGLSATAEPDGGAAAVAKAPAASDPVVVETH